MLRSDPQGFLPKRLMAAVLTRYKQLQSNTTLPPLDDSSSDTASRQAQSREDIKHLFGTRGSDCVGGDVRAPRARTTPSNGLQLSQIAQSDSYETKVMAQLADKTYKDSRTMRIATLVAMLYLPANLVMSLFSTSLLWYETSDGTVGDDLESNSERNASLRIHSEIWIAKMATLLLTTSTENIRQGNYSDHEQENTPEIDLETDCETGYGMSSPGSGSDSNNESNNESTNEDNFRYDITNDNEEVSEGIGHGNHDVNYQDDCKIISNGICDNSISGEALDHRDLTPELSNSAEEAPVDYTPPLIHVVLPPPVPASPTNTSSGPSSIVSSQTRGDEQSRGVFQSFLRFIKAEEEELQVRVDELQHWQSLHNETVILQEQEQAGLHRKGD
ncbi:hypothetical protein F5B21DRAFT_510337 [Xylaria acuta]|nr:hypothetical protein F5B21DRAFT_510337 [Xylaria acuta]